MPENLQKLVHTFAALADLGQEIADTGDFQEMVRTSLHLVLGSLAIRRGAVTEYEMEARVLRTLATRGLGDNMSEYLSLESEDVDELLELGLYAFAPEDESPRVAGFIDRHRGFLAENRIQLLIPFVVRGKLVGLILLGDKATGETYTVEEREVLCAMARHIAVGIQERRLLEELEHRAAENRQLYEGLREIYQDTVKAFAAAIDCKDKYTQGHSERVGKYSEIIAREMGWSDEKVEGIAVAGYLHDIGKLVVERDILNAPYRIDAKQSSELNRHPSAGYDILSPIRHPYADISLMARHHHERLDGRGYPDGLTGDQIPLGAKIVTLADSFDAMTTDRPYKRRRMFDGVIEDFRKNTGKQFEPEVVAALCRAILREVRGEASERRIMRMLGKGYLDAEIAIPLLTAFIDDLETNTATIAVGSS